MLICPRPVASLASKAIAGVAQAPVFVKQLGFDRLRGEEH